MRLDRKGNSSMAAILVSVIILILCGFFQRRFLRAHRDAGTGFSRVLVMLLSLVWAAACEAAVIMLFMFITYKKSTFLILAILCAAIAVFGGIFAGVKSKKAENAA